MRVQVAIAEDFKRMVAAFPPETRRTVGKQLSHIFQDGSGPLRMGERGCSSCSVFGTRTETAAFTPWLYCKFGCASWKSYAQRERRHRCEHWRLGYIDVSFHFRRCFEFWGRSRKRCARARRLRPPACGAGAYRRITSLRSLVFKL